MRRRHSIQTRVLLLTIVGVAGPLMVAVSAAWRIHAELQQELVAERQLTARFFAARVDTLLASGIEPRQLTHWHPFKGYLFTHGESVEVVDGKGAVIASSDNVPRRDDDLTAFASLTVAPGGVLVRQPHGEGEVSYRAIAAVIALLGVALLFAWGAARSVILPLGSLTRAAERLAGGELNTPIRRLADDEIGRLRDALERMRIALKESIVRQLLARTMTAQEQERRRVARELHDETTQGLAALVMKIRAAAAVAPPGPLHARLEEATALAVRTLDEVHRMIVDLRPSVLDDLGLRSAIVWYAEKHLKTRGIAVRCEFADFDRRLPPQHEIAIFRVAQEAMNNIMRHAKAETVLIQAAIKENRLTLEIEDDGEGFDASTLASPIDDGRGFGLMGMRERVEMLGGSVRIASAPGKGTHVTVKLPLQAREEEPWTASAS